MTFQNIKLFALAMLALAVFFFTACNDKDKSDDNQTSEQSVQSENENSNKPNFDPEEMKALAKDAADEFCAETAEMLENFEGDDTKLKADYAEAMLRFNEKYNKYTKSIVFQDALKAEAEICMKDIQEKYKEVLSKIQ